MAPVYKWKGTESAHRNSALPRPLPLVTNANIFFQVVALCREASICALEEDRSANEVRQAHLLEALGQMRPQITPSVLAFYASFHGGTAKIR